jgi:hypothetical protein
MFQSDEAKDHPGSSNVPQLFGQDDAWLHDIKQMRKIVMQQQIDADNVKSEICNGIARERRSVAGLDRKISILEATDPDLYKYIRNLEYLNDGIWCSWCNAPKNAERALGAIREGPIDIRPAPMDK